MKQLKSGLAVMVGILAGIAAASALPPGPSQPPAQCERGACGSHDRRMEQREPRDERSDHHPCDWVETCRVPCAREADTCCHSDWNCPPDRTLPRC